ncbi:L,D-transpeptidase [Domibacillus indicus]|uniref:L,D-transpeptidase n=1 Tax=Domibacillus indicus TaxID=1437523 RepID=UPI000617CD36|nr:L,D-transpeptidase [Domibacillus indicus]
MKKTQNLQMRVNHTKAKQGPSSRTLLALLVFFSCLLLLYTAFVLDRYVFHFTETPVEENRKNGESRQSSAPGGEGAERLLPAESGQELDFVSGYGKKAAAKQEETRGQKSRAALLPADPANLKHIEWLAVNSAIVHFYKANNRYPASLKELAGPYPDNWISYVPEGIAYKRTGRSYTLLSAGTPLDARNELVEITVYPDVHRLALSFQDRPIAVYPAAVGKNGMPFFSSHVTERVIEPNGPGSPFGTRGLVLEQNTAIHGTNRPSSVGKSVTAGCFRLLNAHMEELYPFVPKGTRLNVSSGAPPAPFLPEGLPAAAAGTSLEDEKNPGILYNWRQ